MADLNLFELHGQAHWTDLNPHSLYKPPTQVIRAEEVALFADMNDADLFQREREVLYTDASGNVYHLWLTLLVMDATLTTYSGSASQIEGHIIGEDGALADGAADTRLTIAGALFPYYWDICNDGPVTDYDFVVTDLAVGDAIWVIRRGEVPLYNKDGGSTAIGDYIEILTGGDIGKAAVPAAAPEIFTYLGYWKAVVLNTEIGLAYLDLGFRSALQRT